MSHKANDFKKSPYVIIFLSVLGYLLYTHYPQYALEYLPFAIFLICPLMHIFNHGKHGCCNHAEHGRDHIDQKTFND